MAAGLNIRVDIIRISNDPDDVVGGAQVTGTVVYQDIAARMQANKEEQLLLQQGLQTMRTYNMVIVPGTLDINERDEVQVVKPTDHPDYGNRFRIVGVRKSDHLPRDPRNYAMLALTRSVEAHAQQ